MKKATLTLLVFLAITQFTSCNDDDTSEVKVVLEANDLKVSIDENPEMDTVIGKIQASTNKGTLSYSLVLQTPENAVSINSASGEIRVKTPEVFDYEKINLIEAVVQVSNGIMNEIANLSISLNDLDDDLVDEKGIFRGDVTLSTQSELESFMESDYHTIDGDVTISDDPNLEGITDMAKLLSLTTITGVLKIDNMLNLLDLSGLDNISSLGGITISNNWGILDVNGLLNVTTCNGPILITDNTSLEYFCGLQPLLKSGNFSDTFSVTNNMLNPTIEDIIAQDCD